MKTKLLSIFCQFFEKFEDRFLQLIAGRPAKSNDIWFRDITNTDHVKEKDGVMRLHHAAFKGKAISQPSHKKWLSEISGRLNSKAGTIDSIKEYGEKRANLVKERATQKGQSGRKFTYMGVFFKSVKEIRELHLMKADIIYDPTEKPIYDKAHANFVSYDKDTSYFEDLEILKMLCDYFQFVPVNDLENSPLGKK